MTAGELIEKLRSYDKNAPVFVDVESEMELKCIEDVSESIGTFIDYKTDLRYKCPILKLER